MKRWREAAWPLAQSALAAGLSWLIAVNVGAFSSTVLVAQLRSTTVDMLQAAGMTREQALAALPSSIRARPRRP